MRIRVDKPIVTLLLLTSLVACSKTQEPDKPVGGGNDVSPTEFVQVAWLDSVLRSEAGSAVPVTAESLASGAIADPLYLSTVIAAVPTSAFLGGAGQVPFLGLAFEEGAQIVVQHVKTVGSTVASSEVVVPIDCPASFVAAPKFARPATARVQCIPMISAVVPSILDAGDAGKNVEHQFTIMGSSSGKNLKPVSMSVRLMGRIYVEKSSLTAKPSEQFSALSLAERLKVAVSSVGDANGSFPLFEISGAVSPGFSSTWTLCASSNAADLPKIQISEEIFYEQPIRPGRTSMEASTSRGNAFRKRTQTLDSASHFRIKLMDSAGNGYKIPETPGECVQIPTESPTAPFKIYVAANFQQLRGIGKSLQSFIQPIGPSRCPAADATFQYHAWINARTNPDYMSCDAFSKRSINSVSEYVRNLASGASLPIETFFGWGTFVPRTPPVAVTGAPGALGSYVTSPTGYLSGVYSFSATMSGKLRLSIKDPDDGIREIAATPGFESVAASGILPTAVEEMGKLVAVGKAPPGMDSVRAALVSQGFTSPKVSSGRVFPFGRGAETSPNILY